MNGDKLPSDGVLGSYGGRPTVIVDCTLCTNGVPHDFCPEIYVAFVLDPDEKLMRKIFLGAWSDVLIAPLGGICVEQTVELLCKVVGLTEITSKSLVEGYINESRVYVCAMELNLSAFADYARKWDLFWWG